MTSPFKLGDIPIGEGRAYVIDGAQVAVFRPRDGTPRALGATCPHRGGPLADGLLDDRVVICPLHGYSYDLVTGLEIGNGGDPVCAYDVNVGADGTFSVDARSG